MSGRCIAGKVYRKGSVQSEWVRPVSVRPHQEISEEDRRYDNGARAKLMEVIQIRFTEHAPSEYQQENHLIDDNYYWSRIGQATKADLETAVDSTFNKLWINGHNSYSGTNDRIPLADAKNLMSSLAFIKPRELRVKVSAEGAAFGNNKRKVRARFHWHNEFYALTVTDPFIEHCALAQPDGEHVIPEAFMCVSLGEPFQDYVYKLVASIITSDRVS